jgi:hypothetical protein
MRGERMMEGYSLSDIAAATGNGNNNGFGNNGDWAWIIVLFLIFGWGRNGFGGGFGGNGGGYSGVPDNFALQTDFATIERKLDSVNSGICDSTFALNNTMTNGFAGVQQTLCQGFSGINQNIVTNGYETRLATQGLSSQLANCCCDIRQQISDCCCTTQRGIDAVNYNMAMNTNSIQQTLCNNTRDIIENQNANYRALHDEIVANKLEEKTAQITAQQNEINALRLAASQEKQNNYLTATMNANVAEIIRRTGNDCPIPAYVVNGPTPINFPTNCCGQYVGYNGGCNNF